MHVELLPTDCLAMDCGIASNSADQSLKRFLAKAVGSAEAQLWDLLPFMFAASFTSILWRDAQFKAQLEGHTSNLHTLAKTINDLTIAFKSITTTSNDIKEIAGLLKSFLEISAVLLLRMAKGGKDKHVPNDFSSVIVFMDKFVDCSPLLTRDVLETCIPYALLRNHWKQIYSSKSGKKETPTDVY